ncbi:FAD-dependent monooxygenase [Actinopolyspora mortivallis]|uniref:Monooxygenase n=1 Tax=Actinopolyspora mortivallis TaxID=33906 RepID=A0A2T0GYU6_ACTMO|nr:FAD-dependent monooxygenase [Actinopolyspora mortivallis]PRW64203.1 monooxygenase [Actinopolyspora mortivallis]
MDAPVIVVGAGPAGLVLAGELRLAGVNVIVVERLYERTGESRGLGFTARTMEVFDQRGLLPRFGEIETSNQGHFGGIPVDFGVLEGAHQAAKTIPQSTTEAVLEEWVRELGTDIRRGHEVRSIRDRGDGVEVTVRSAEEEYTLRSDWLVGCDGGRSTVRKAVGFDFPGTAATMEMFLADLRGVELESRMIGETVPGGMVMVGQLPGDITRIIVCERDNPPQRRTQPPEFSEVADAWKRLTGVDISHAEPVWVSAFGDATRQVTEYRKGRVLLSGDAAHIHLPAGGQGMNASIQDSVNLGWKLAAVVRGTAPEALLDTYHEERHQVGKRLLMNTQAQGLLFLSGEQMQPLREVFSELVGYEEVSRYLAAMVSGLDIHYDVGSGRHPLLGYRMPKTKLLHRGRERDSTELLHQARGLLLDLEDNPTLRRRAAGWEDRVDIITAPLAEETGELAGTAAVLVRPDGYVAWAAPGSDHDLPMALERWFGPGRND